ncbi:MAG TPA: hypothetical protein VIV88_18785 [Gemmatimonadales bacterium]
MKRLIVDALVVYVLLGSVTVFAWMTWDTAERSRKRIHRYPGPGFAGCFIGVIWPLVAFGLYRLYTERKREQKGKT